MAIALFLLLAAGVSMGFEAGQANPDAASVVHTVAPQFQDDRAYGVDEAN